MPAVSQAQFNLFKGICEGSIPKERWPKGMTREKACEYVRGQSPKGLPEKAAKGKVVEGPALVQLGEKGWEYGLLAPGSIIAPPRNKREKPTMAGGLQAAIAQLFESAPGKKAKGMQYGGAVGGSLAPLTGQGQTRYLPGMGQSPGRATPSGGQWGAGTRQMLGRYGIGGMGDLLGRGGGRQPDLAAMYENRRTPIGGRRALRQMMPYTGAWEPPTATQQSAWGAPAAAQRGMAIAGDRGGYMPQQRWRPVGPAAGAAFSPTRLYKPLMAQEGAAVTNPRDIYGRQHGWQSQPQEATPEPAAAPTATPTLPAELMNLPFMQSLMGGQQGSLLQRMEGTAQPFGPDIRMPNWQGMNYYDYLRKPEFNQQMLQAIASAFGMPPEQAVEQMRRSTGMAYGTPMQRGFVPHVR